MSEHLEPATVEFGELRQEVYGWKYTLPKTENRGGVEITLTPAETKSKARWRIDVEYLCDMDHGDSIHQHEGDHLYINSDAQALMQFGYLVYGSESRVQTIQQMDSGGGMAELLGAALARRFLGDAVPMAGSPTGNRKTITQAEPSGNYL